MRAGRLDRRITLQSRGTSQSASGEYTETFTTLDVVWAEVTDLRGQEFFAAQQTNAEVTTRFRIRYRDDFNVLDRIRYDGKTYNAVQVSELGRRGGLEILAQAEVPGTPEVV